MASHPFIGPNKLQPPVLPANHGLPPVTGRITAEQLVPDVQVDLVGPDLKTDPLPQCLSVLNRRYLLVITCYLHDKLYHILLSYIHCIKSHMYIFLDVILLMIERFLPFFLLFYSLVLFLFFFL